jgi:predicted Rossmann fold nucleotide-binding protein DprA/Smf involved in DNA uptake
LGNDAAVQGYSIVSGGARGIDEAAMQGALAQEGTGIGVLADSLLRAATSAKYRKALMANNLVLISPFNPEAGFDVGNAMSRNKYIYCLADAAVVVSSSKNKGGTWNGAIEDLKQRWVPLWVKQSSDPSSGNAELVRQGGRWFPGKCFELAVLLRTEDQIDDHHAMHDKPKAESLEPAQMSLLENKEPPPVIREPSLTDTLGKEPENTAQVSAVEKASEPGSFYKLFLLRFQELTTKAPMNADEMLIHLDICKAQLNEWLKQAFEDGYVRKLSKPIRYQWQLQQPLQPSIFDD